ncbi:MAG TPA: c-type cytochrome [Steroidobacteraceae bacterium]|nr:c-type cytochrome [Steroidobacteraceae bacterium]
MIHRQRIWCTLLAAAMPIIGLGAPAARQEYVNAMNAKPDAGRGGLLFATCAACHGPDGGGTVDGNVPRIAGQHRQVIVKQITDYRHARRGDPRMEYIADKHVLKDAQAIADVAQFISALEPQTPAGTGRGDALELGRQIYLGRCSACHRRSGEGDAQAIAPRLAGQHYAYLLRQSNDALEGRRPELASTHNQLLRDLERAGLQALADVLSRADRTEGQDRR